MFGEPTLVSTGYFAQVEKYIAAGYQPISIALVRPWFLKPSRPLKELTELAPTKDILALAKAGQFDAYEEAYRTKILGKLNLMDIRRKITTLAYDRGGRAVLLCYESPEKFCHRHLVAKWLTEKTHIEVREFPV